MSGVLNLDTGKFDPEQAAWAARKWIGYILIGLLIGIVLGALVILYRINMAPIDFRVPATAAAQAADAKADAERLVAVLNIVFAPITTLVGTIAGFYFGSKAAEGQG